MICARPTISKHSISKILVGTSIFSHHYDSNGFVISYFFLCLTHIVFNVAFRMAWTKHYRSCHSRPKALQWLYHLFKLKPIFYTIYVMRTGLFTNFRLPLCSSQLILSVWLALKPSMRQNCGNVYEGFSSQIMLSWTEQF